MRKLKGLEPFISVSVVNPLMLENGWTFDDSFPGATGDTLYQHEFLYQLYLHADRHYSGRVTVPVLWDKKNHTIVSNESAEIIRMFNTAFDALGAKAGDYYPPALQTKIDELNGWIYDTVNNGVYKAGFATSQQAYDEAVAKVFESLARLEQILGQHRYLTGNQLTEADIRRGPRWSVLIQCMLTTFKCDKHRISDYLNRMASCAISTRCRELPKQSISITSVIITSAAIRPSTLRGLFQLVRGRISMNRMDEMFASVKKSTLRGASDN